MKAIVQRVSAAKVLGNVIQAYTLVYFVLYIVQFFGYSWYILYIVSLVLADPSSRRGAIASRM